MHFTRGEDQKNDKGGFDGVPVDKVMNYKKVTSIVVYVHGYN